MRWACVVRAVGMPRRPLYSRWAYSLWARLVEGHAARSLPISPVLLALQCRAHRRREERAWSGVGLGLESGLGFRLGSGLGFRLRLG